MLVRNFKRHRISKKKILLILLFLTVFLIIIDYQLRPLIKSVAEKQAQIYSTKVINETIEETLEKLNLNYNDIIIAEKDEQGKILSFNTNVRQVNRLKTYITLAVQEKISFIEKKKIKIPIGTLTGTEIFNGRGPSIPLKVSMSGSVITDFRSEFQSSGINQTMHRLYIDISTSVFALIPGYPVTTAVKTTALIAETVILGDVPNVLKKLPDE